jgi:hypothetical protein
VSDLSDDLDEHGAVAGCELHCHPGDVDLALRRVVRDYRLVLKRDADIAPGYCYLLCPPESFTGTLLLDDAYPQPYAEDSLLVSPSPAAAGVS